MMYRTINVSTLEDANKQKNIKVQYTHNTYNRSKGRARIIVGQNYKIYAGMCADEMQRKYYGIIVSVLECCFRNVRAGVCV